ncbi:MAG: mechanosensitive ion channel [Candidatus Bathyarchaeia archaeon]
MPLLFDSLEVPDFLIGLAIVALHILAAWVALYLARRLLRPWAQRTETTLDDEVIKATRLPAYFALLLAGLFAAMPYFASYLPENIYALVLEYLDVLGIAIVGLIAYKAFHVFTTWYGRVVAKRTETKIDDILIPIINKIGKTIIVLLVILFILNTFKVDVTAPLAGVGIASLAVALAAQDTISNFLAGFFIMLDRPFREGDTIQLPSGELCQVTQIGIRRTKLYDLNMHNCIIVPNLDLSRWKITNYELPDSRLRVTVPVSVPLEQDTDAVKTLLKQIASEARHISPEPLPEVYLTGLTAAAQRLELVMHVNYRERAQLLDEVNTRIKKEFAARGIRLM